MKASQYEKSVFINCPFDTEYGALLDALIFAVHDCGFVSRCALETLDSGQVRIDKIVKLIAKCKYGIHDISRTDLDVKSKLPRFNMPLELGLFLGARSFGNHRHKKKICLIVDKDRYRFQKFCSDIAGQDIKPHRGHPQRAIVAIRDWLHTHTRHKIPSGDMIVLRYAQFRKTLPEMCKSLSWNPKKLTYNDYTTLVVDWLKVTDSTTALPTQKGM